MILRHATAFSVSSITISTLMFAEAMPAIASIPPIIVKGKPHVGVQPVWMKIRAEAKASMLEVSVASCGVSFLFVYMYMAMLNQARIAAI